MPALFLNWRKTRGRERLYAAFREAVREVERNSKKSHQETDGSS